MAKGHSKRAVGSAAKAPETAQPIRDFGSNAEQLATLGYEKSPSTLEAAAVDIGYQNADGADVGYQNADVPGPGSALAEAYPDRDRPKR